MDQAKKGFRTGQWTEALPQETGIDDHIISDFHKELERRGKGVYASVMIKKGFMIYENYFNGFDRDTPGNLYSATKSFVSALIGIAIDQKYMNIGDLVVDYYEEFCQGTAEWYKEDITVENLLTMSSGIFCPANAGFNHRMSISQDELYMLLRLPVNRKNIGKFSYNDANYHLLSGIISKATKMSPMEFAQKELFHRLNITGTKDGKSYPKWEADAQNRNYGGFGLYLCARDMAKLGYLFMNEGYWGEERLLSKEWIDRSISPQIKTTQKDVYYGYGWWIREINGLTVFYALGSGGQYILCVPSLDLLIVFLCNKNSMAFREVECLWENLILEIRGTEGI